MASLFGVSILTARGLGPAGKGEYFLVTTLAAILVQVCNIGSHSSNTYLVAQAPERLGRLTANSLWLALAGALPVAGLTVLLIRGIGLLPLKNPDLLWFLIAIAPANLFFLLGSSLLVGVARISAYNMAQACCYLAMLALIAAGLFTHQRVDGFLALTTCAWVLSAMLLWWALRADVRSLKFDWTVFAIGAGYGARAYAALLLGLLVVRAHAFILKHYLGDGAVGYFSVAAQVADGLNILPVTVALLLFPKLVRNQREGWEMMLSALKTTALAMLLICASGAVLARPVIRIAYGPAYLPAVQLLIWMMPGVFFIALTSIVSQYLSSRGFPIEQVMVWILAFAGVVISGVVLVPRYHLLGAGLSFSLTCCGLFTLMFLLAFRYRVRSRGLTEAGVVLAISAYALSADYKRRLEAAIGPSQQLTLLELRRLSIAGAMRKLRSVTARRVLIPFEQGSGRAMLPLLLTAAAFTRADSIRIVDGDRLDSADAGIPQFVAAWLDAGIACAGGLAAAARCWLDIRRLRGSRRIAAKPCRLRDVFYLNANMWVGAVGAKIGGPVGHIAGVANGLARRGFRMTYFSMTDRGQIGHDVEWRKLPEPRRLGFPMDLNRFRFQHEVVRQVRSAAAVKRPGFIYQRLSVADYAGVTLSRELGVPLVLEYNCSEVWVSQNWGARLGFAKLASAVEETCLKHAHMVVTVSDALRRELLQRGVDAERIVTYPNCVDADRYDPDRITGEQAAAVRRRYGIAPDAMVATFVSTFGPWHGAEVLARAIRLLAETQPGLIRENRLRFMLIGDGPEMQQTRSILEFPAAAGTVTLTGLIAQEEAAFHLAASDILLSPHVGNPDGSVFFGSPTKLFEYMAMGKPIVASDLGQIAEVLSPGLSVRDLPLNEPAPDYDGLAILCRPGEPGDIVEALGFLVRSSQWRKVLGENARRKVLASYTWDRHVEAILDGMRRLGLVDRNWSGAAQSPANRRLTIPEPPPRMPSKVLEAVARVKS